MTADSSLCLDNGRPLRYRDLALRLPSLRPSDNAVTSEPAPLPVCLGVSSLQNARLIGKIDHAANSIWLTIVL